MAIAQGIGWYCRAALRAAPHRFPFRCRFRCRLSYPHRVFAVALQLLNVFVVAVRLLFAPAAAACSQRSHPMFTCSSVASMVVVCCYYCRCCALVLLCFCDVCVVRVGREISAVTVSAARVEWSGVERCGLEWTGAPVCCAVHSHVHMCMCSRVLPARRPPARPLAHGSRRDSTDRCLSAAATGL